MYKIYSRPRIRIPKVKIQKEGKIQDPKTKKVVEIVLILIIAFSTMKLILDAVLPIFDTLCENRAESIATIASNEQATNVMREHSYEDMFTIEKDSNQNITMIKSNVIVINEIISDVAIKIQEDVDNRGREDLQIAIRKLYRI